MNRFIQMNKNDMVATALVDLKQGETAQVFSASNEIVAEVLAKEDIPYGNKIALQDIKKEEQVIKYNAVIGEATENIGLGELVHVHNVKSLVVDIPEAFKKEIMRQMRDTKKEG